MLKDHMRIFMNDFEIDPQYVTMPQPDQYVFTIDPETLVYISKVDNGFYLHSPVGSVPKEVNKETFYCKLMDANLFHQGTFGGILGLSDDTKQVNYSRLLSDDITYVEFRDAMEDYLNTLKYWQDHLKTAR